MDRKNLVIGILVILILLLIAAGIYAFFYGANLGYELCLSEIQ